MKLEFDSPEECRAFAENYLGCRTNKNALISILMEYSSCFKNREKIKAIKLIRAHTELDLFAAKNLVESIW